MPCDCDFKMQIIRFFFFYFVANNNCLKHKQEQTQSVARWKLDALRFSLDFLISISSYYLKIQKLASKRITSRIMLLLLKSLALLATVSSKNSTHTDIHTDKQTSIFIFIDIRCKNLCSINYKNS